MNPFAKFRLALATLFRRRHLDTEMDAELRAHIDLQTRENIETGMSPEGARQAAMREFGHLDSIKEIARDQRGVAWLENLGRDLGEAARRLRKDPGFTAVAAITLALGIGANTVVFSIAKAVLFRSLGFEQASQLAWIHQENRSLSRVEESLSWIDYADIQTASKSFASLAMFGSPGATWEHGDQVEEVTALIVTPELSEILRIRPALGRLIQPADVESGAQPVVAISHEMWMTRFGGRPDILGQTLRLSDKPRTVVGVLPPGLEFPLQRAPSAGTGSIGHAGVQAVWLPLRVEGEDRQARGNRMFSVIGRLKPEASITAAKVELGTLSRRWEADHPETNRGWTFTPVEFRDQVLGRTRPGIKVLAAAVAAVLLICCVNLANLLLARGVNRRRELAVRSALGAGRSRMIRTLLTECLLLSLLGCVPGMMLAAATVRGIQLVGATEVPFLREATVDWRVLAFTGGLAVFTTLLFGLFPAIWMSRVDPANALRSGARSSSGPESTRWQKGLLAGQLAIVLTLLVSAGLLLESFRRLMSLHPGYESRPVIALDISTWGFDTNGDVCRFYRALRERLAALPGVEAVGTTSSAPLTGKWTFDEKPQVVGQPVPEAERPLVAARFVAFDYFQAMGIPLVEGRLFRDSELKDDGYGQIVILNESAAARLFPGRSAIGGRFTVGSNTDRVLEVIGVVKDTREVRLEEKPRPTFYWQYAFGGAQVLIRGSVPVRALIPLVQAALTQTDPRVTSTSDASSRPVNARIMRHSIQPMTEIIAGTVAERRFAMVMITAYALLALGIALVGVLGVVGYQVAQRTNEFGIRLALGALPAHLTRLVVAQAGRLVVFGLGFGLLVSLGVTRLLQSQLFGLSPTDPLVLGGITLSLGGCALLACWWPARRAAKVDPLIALRAD